MFDPLDCTKEDQEAMVKGYMDATSGDKLPQDSSLAYRHGWRVGRNDKKGKVEEFQRLLAERMIGLRAPRATRSE